MVNRTSVMSMDSVSSKLHRNTMMIVPRFLGMTIFLRLLSVRFMFPRFSTILFGKNKQTWTIKRPSSLFQKHDSEATGTSVAYSIFHHLPAGRYSYCSDDIRNYVSKQNGKNGKLTVIRTSLTHLWERAFICLPTITQVESCTNLMSADTHTVCVHSVEYL